MRTPTANNSLFLSDLTLTETNQSTAQCHSLNANFCHFTELVSNYLAFHKPAHTLDVDFRMNRTILTSLR